MDLESNYISLDSYDYTYIVIIFSLLFDFIIFIIASLLYHIPNSSLFHIIEYIYWIGNAIFLLLIYSNTRNSCISKIMYVFKVIMIIIFIFVIISKNNHDTYFLECQSIIKSNNITYDCNKINYDCYTYLKYNNSNEFESKCP